MILGAINITMLAPHSIDFARAASAAGQLFKLIDRASLIDPLDTSGEKPSETQGLVELENVTFAYPTRPGITVLDDFTLTVPAGKVTAIVVCTNNSPLSNEFPDDSINSYSQGQSGSGKSTIVGLIERWYNPISGVIKLDGRPIEDLNLSWLRKNVRLVQQVSALSCPFHLIYHVLTESPQEPVLFQGSVFDNIAHGLVGSRWEDAPKEEKLAQIQAAAKLAFAHDFVSELPDGYDTDIGQRGSLLSGGQKQRIAIARAVASEPKVLLLDEATSALDPHAEGIVQQALDRASEGRTTIVIAHKLATIRKADNIVVMSKGRIIEQGTHSGLIAQGGTYARFVEIQNLTVSGQEKAAEEAEIQDEDDGELDPDVAKTLTRYGTADRKRLESQMDRDKYENYAELGFIGVIWRFVKEHPELRAAYICSALGCIGGCKSSPLS